MTVYEVWGQWPMQPIATFRTLDDALDFKLGFGHRLAMPIIVTKEIEK